MIPTKGGGTTKGKGDGQRQSIGRNNNKPGICSFKYVWVLKKTVTCWSSTIAVTGYLQICYNIVLFGNCSSLHIICRNCVYTFLFLQLIYFHSPIEISSSNDTTLLSLQQHNGILSWWGIASTVAPPQYCWTFSFVISLRFPRNLLSNLYQVFRLKPNKAVPNNSLISTLYIYQLEETCVKTRKQNGLLVFYLAFLPIYLYFCPSSKCQIPKRPITRRETGHAVIFKNWNAQVL